MRHPPSAFITCAQWNSYKKSAPDAPPLLRERHNNYSQKRHIYRSIFSHPAKRFQTDAIHIMKSMTNFSTLSQFFAWQVRVMEKIGPLLYNLSLWCSPPLALYSNSNTNQLLQFHLNPKEFNNCHRTEREIMTSVQPPLGLWIDSCWPVGWTWALTCKIRFLAFIRQ